MAPRPMKADRVKVVARNGLVVIQFFDELGQVFVHAPLPPRAAVEIAGRIMDLVEIVIPQPPTSTQH